MWPRIGECVILALLIAATAGRGAAAQEKLKEALLAQETKLIDAINKQDKTAIAELLADEAVSITSRGQQSTADVIRSLEQLSFSDYKISEAKMIAVSPDVAILTYTFSWTGGVTGQPPATTTVYAASVWRQRDGKWRSVFYQETPVAANQN